MKYRFGFNAIPAYYFANKENCLRYRDGRVISEGVTHKISGVPRVCSKGLHASVHLIDAMLYAPGPNLYQVKLSGLIDVSPNGDKLSAQRRKYVKQVPIDIRKVIEFLIDTVVEQMVVCPSIMARLSQKMLRCIDNELSTDVMLHEINVALKELNSASISIYSRTNSDYRLLRAFREITHHLDSHSFWNKREASPLSDLQVDILNVLADAAMVMYCAYNLSSTDRKDFKDWRKQISQELEQFIGI